MILNKDNRDRMLQFKQVIADPQMLFKFDQQSRIVENTNLF